MVVRSEMRGAELSCLREESLEAKHRTETINKYRFLGGNHDFSRVERIRKNDDFTSFGEKR